MRITNTMISDNAMTYVGANKVTVDANNTRMTTQKKIDRPSEDPVVAIRSLRLQTSLDKINQFYEKNIPDATSWMDVTETALLNIKDIMTDVRTLCVQGATDTLTEDDRKTIYTQLKSLQEQLFKEGNADYAGRTVFTGFRTNKDLVFSKDEAKTSYTMQQPFSAEDMEFSRFYTNKVTVPTNREEVLALDDGTSGVESDDMTIQETNFYKLSLAYNLPNQDTDGVTAMHFYDTETVNGNDTWIERGTITFDDTRYAVTDPTTAVDPATYTGRTFSMTDLEATLTPPDKDDTKYVDNLEQYYKDLDLYNENVQARNYVKDTFGEGSFTKIYQFETEEDWANWSKLQTYIGKFVPDSAIVIIKENGDVMAGETAAMTMMNERAHMSFDYKKTGFLNGELKPEYYFDCTYLTDSYGVDQGIPDADGNRNGLVYDRYDKSKNTDGDTVMVKKAAYSIEYTVSQNQTLGVNLEADQCFNHDLYQDMYDMINSVSASQLAHEKVDKLKAMMAEDQYQTDEYQEKLTEWLRLAQKEMDYYDNNLSKLYSTTLGKVDTYLDKINLAITDLGCREDRCALTKSRMSEQQETVEELQSINDDLDLSEILMRYTASYTAYQSSLVAAGKLGDVTLLNYI